MLIIKTITDPATLSICTNKFKCERKGCALYKTMGQLIAIGLIDVSKVMWPTNYQLDWIVANWKIIFSKAR
jgi:hypothetical protein